MDGDGFSGLHIPGILNQWGDAKLSQNFITI
jgi:hypothetical protein